MGGKERVICLYPSTDKIHTAYKSFMKDPPKGYKVVHENRQNSRIKLIIAKIPFVKKIYRKILPFFGISILNLQNPDPDHSRDLTYSMGLIYYKGPYVLDLIDNPISIAGYNYELFIKNLKYYSDSLLDEKCKAIICSNKDCFEMMKKYFPPEVIKKCHLVYNGITVKKTKRVRKKSFTLLFMGSITNPRDFYIKGGLETLNAFESLPSKENIKLIIRCKIPEELVKRIKSNKKIILMQDEVPMEEIEKIYLKSDALIMPGHHFHLMATLEAMSYGLPILALDTYAFSDFVINGYNGFLIKKSIENELYNSERYPVNVRDKEFIEKIKNSDSRVVNDLKDKIIFLANNRKSTLLLGKNSLKLVKKKFSYDIRKKILKSIFDKAISI